MILWRGMKSVCKYSISHTHLLTLEATTEAN